MNANTFEQNAPLYFSGAFAIEVSQGDFYLSADLPGLAIDINMVDQMGHGVAEGRHGRLGDVLFQLIEVVIGSRRLRSDGENTHQRQDLDAPQEGHKANKAGNHMHVGHAAEAMMNGRHDTVPDEQAHHHQRRGQADLHAGMDGVIKPIHEHAEQPRNQQHAELCQLEIRAAKARLVQQVGAELNHAAQGSGRKDEGEER